MQTFEQWWNEIEGYGLRAERFTTPGDAAKAAWDQAMSLRAQADARPVGHFFKASRVHPWVQVEKECQNAVPLYTHPEASSPGLSEDEWLALAERHIRADWNSEQPDGYLNAVKALVQDAMSLTRASAATASPDARIEELRKGLFEARDAMRVMSNWVKQSDPAGHSWGVRMVDRANAVLSGASAATVGETNARRPLTADEVAAQYDEQGIHIGSGLPAETCPCGLCKKVRESAQQQAEHVGQACGDSAEHVGIQQVEPGADEVERAAIAMHAMRRDLANGVGDRTFDMEFDNLPDEIKEVDRALARAAIIAAQPGQRAGVPIEAVAKAYGYLWHVNEMNADLAPFYPPAKAAYAARKVLREFLTHEQRGEAINEAGREIGRYVDESDRAAPTQQENSK